MIIFGVISALVSCGGNPPTTECTEHTDNNGDGICDNEGCGTVVPPAPSADVFNENGELYLFKDGVPTFRFVMGKDTIKNFSAKIKDLSETLSLYTKDNLMPEIVNYTAEPTDVEILIGTFDNRGDEYKINGYDYGMTGYIVKQIGTKIVVHGGSDDALENAISYLKSTVFEIKKSNENFTDFVMASDKSYDVKQSNYSLKDITVAGNSIRDYVITYVKGDKIANEAAKTFQAAIYNKCGIYLEIVIEADANDARKLAIRNIENDGKGGGFYITVDDAENLVFESEYSGKTADLILDYFEKNVFNKKDKHEIPAGYEYAPDLRNIYYKDYGAKGDGITDDFFAIKAAHDEANKYYLNVHADPDATYYIGNANGSYSINIRTNTYFHGCKFIFDDENVDYTSKGRQTSIFGIRPNYGKATYNKNTTPIKTLEKGATNIGWAPGDKVMVVLYQEDVRHYIRYGANASQSSDPTKWGQAQHELIIVDADGNVDPSTPIQWTYTAVTSMEVYRIDDVPIEIRGEGEGGRRTLITTLYNDAPNAYWYYFRNFDITRSNVTISGLEHEYKSYVPYDEGGNGAPYSGFIRISECNNVTIDNIVYECPPGYKDVEPTLRPSGSPNVTNGGMGSYEISAGLANNVTWSNSTQSNFFQPDGGIIYDGSMGTNFCKNLTFDNMFTCSFDAHCGVYNGTIRNSTLEHINFIGDGLITLENVTVYADANRAAINLRDDYGSTWAGDVYIDGLIFKVNDKRNPTDLHIVKAKWNNWYFGYTTYLPQHITLKNVLTAEYTYTLVGEGNGTSNRVESDVYVYNELTVRAFHSSINESIINLGASTYFSEKNKNPMVATKEIRLYTEYTGKYAELGITKPLNFKEPSGPFFNNLEYYIDGVLQ